jgi:cell cycle sensor histidine kinase DivJ
MLKHWLSSAPLAKFYPGQAGESALSRDVARKRAFVSSRMTSGLAVLAILPIYVLITGWPQLTEFIAILWLSSPVLVGYLLKRTGRLELCHILSAANMTGLITYLAFLTGGIGSFLTAWFIVIPGEAALSGTRRAISLATLFVLIALAGLWAAGTAGLLPPSRIALTETSMIAVACLILAALYAASMAIYVHFFSSLAEGQADAEEARYRFLAHHTQDMVLRLDSDGAIVVASDNARNFLKVGELASSRPSAVTLLHQDDRAAFLHAFENAREGKPLARLELRLDSEYAQGQWAEWSLCRIDSPNGRGTAEPAIVAVLRNIDERKRYERELIEAQEAAEAASRAKSRFLASMSHELRTPLNAIIGFSDIIKQQMLGPIGVGRYSDYAKLISESGTHLLGLISDVLDVANLETGRYVLNIERFTPSELAGGILADLQPAAELRGIRITSHIPDDLPHLVADKRACRQILGHLLMNAIKFSLDRSEIAFEIAADAKNGNITFTLADQGPGIAPKLLERLGRPFETANDGYHLKEEASGSGLGLSIVRGLVELHGGKFLVTSKVGKGTTVQVVLPVRQSAGKAKSEPSFAAA